MIQKQCPECGFVLPDNTSECPNCGCPIESQTDSAACCPECGSPIVIGATSCPNCGFPIEWESAPIICPECGTEIEMGMSACPNCAYPIEEIGIPETYTINHHNCALEETPHQPIEGRSITNISTDIQSKQNTEQATTQTKKKSFRGLIIVFAILSVASFAFGFFYAKQTNTIIKDCMESISNRNSSQAWGIIAKAGKRITTSKQKAAIDVAYNRCHELDRILEQERQERIRQEELRREEERREAERRRQEEKKQEFLSWLQGTWSWSGRIHVYGSQYTYVNCKLVVDGDYVTLYGNDGISNQGRIDDVDFEEGAFTFGGYSRAEFDYSRRILYYDKSEGLRFERTSDYSESRSSYSSRSSSSNTTTTFRTSSDVMAYLSNSFRNSRGNTITVKYDGLYSNGNQITNAVRVTNFNGSRATLTATSPYTQGTLYFTVDASRGTFTDGSGDVFYIR